MNPNPSSLPAAAPEIHRAQRWNVVWVVPIIALFIGAWLLYRNFAAQGPVAQIRFETAEEIHAGTTEIRCRSVRVGLVKRVRLEDDLKSVLVHVEMDTAAEHLLRDGSRFWVVKPRLSAAEISGLGTLIQGSYIELDPGPPESQRANYFQGLETPPSTNLSVPGLRLTLTVEAAGSLTIGAPIYHRGFEVGRIEGRKLNEDGMGVTYNAFIAQAYAGLVTENTRFWNTSGIDISAGSDGFKIRTPSIQAMVSGGVSFGVTLGELPGKQATDGMTFPLFSDENSARNSTFNPSIKLLLLFDQTVRGLSVRAPVEFRGITMGRVADISFELLPTIGDPRIPVLIEIDPSLMRPRKTSNGSKSDMDFIREAVSKGMRAALKTGNLITGSLYVDLDIYEDVAPLEMTKAGEFYSIPTISSGFAQLEAKLTAILDKLQALPLEKTMSEIAAASEEARVMIAGTKTTLQEIEATAAAARRTLENPEFQELPADLRKSIAALEKSISSMGPDGAIQGDLLRTLDELRASLRSLKSMTNTIDEKPNSLLFGRETSGNPEPKAPR